MHKHPLVYEFLQIDHEMVDPKWGLKNFQKKLIEELSNLKKLNSIFTSNKIMKNDIYRICESKNLIDLKSRFKIK